jgi:coenzyme PQQ synthesis protein D (PqqD)
MGFKTANTDKAQSQNPASAERRPQRRSDLICRTIDGATVILSREDGVLHQLNATAGFIWNCCDGTVGVPEIADRVTNAYEIDYVTCRKDVDEVLNKLQTLKLLIA